MACGTPEDEAPELLTPLSDADLETYFVRQPQTPTEIEQACRAVEVCCVNSLRYGGTEPAILHRLGNRAEYCDHPLPGGPTRTRWETDAQWRAIRREWRRASAPWWRFWNR